MTFTISILIKSTLILLFTIALVILLKKSSASLRHFVICLGLLGLFLLPVFQHFTPTIEIEMPIVEHLDLEAVPLIWNAHPSLIEPSKKKSPELIQQDIDVPVVAVPPPLNTSQKTVPFFQVNMDVKAVLLWIWILGCTVFSMRVLVQIIRIWFINRKSKSISLSLEDLDLQMKRKVKFLSNPMIKTPMTFGLFQPKVLLPTTAQTWTKEQMEIVLLHELAHIKRHDYLLHLLGLLTLSFYWFHPLVWLLQKWQQSEREKACDEYVLKQGISKTNYAESLVSIARNMLTKRTHRWHSSLPMAASSETKKRVLAILKFDLQQWQFTRWMQWRWVGFFACVLPLLAAIHPATKNIIEEQIPKIEAVLEQPVFTHYAVAEEKVKPKQVSEKEEEVITSGYRSDAIIAALPSILIKNIEPINPSLAIIPKYNMPVKEEKEYSIWSFGKWYISADQSIKIWTKGTFNIKEEYPYFSDLSDDAVIIIELKETSGKTNKLLIKKSNYNGWITKNLLPTEIAVKEGETVFTWVGRNQRKATTVQHLNRKSVGFLANQASGVHGKWKAWMTGNIQAIAQKMRDLDDEHIWKTVETSSSKNLWHQTINDYLEESFQWIHPASDSDYEKMSIERNTFRLEMSNEKLDIPQMEGLYGKWEEEDKIIEIWTRGHFEVQHQFPYFVNLERDGRIEIRVKSKKYWNELIIQPLHFNAVLKDKRDKEGGIPVNAGQILYTYLSDNKAIQTTACSDLGGCTFSGGWKERGDVLGKWGKFMAKDLVRKIQEDKEQQFLQPIKNDNERWERITNLSSSTSRLSHIQKVNQEDWNRILNQYRLRNINTHKKGKKKGQFVSLNLPSEYVYIPSGTLKSNKKGERKETSVQGFHMSSIEITNYKYRDFLIEMERRGKTELLKKVKIHNENWIRKYHYGELMYNEPLANIYHVHPAFNEYPVVNVSYEGAQAYCQWMTELYKEVNKNSGWEVEFRLPNKEEWMYAAKGGHDLAYYPWGGYYVRNAKGCYLGNFKQIDESKLIFDSKSNTFTVADSVIVMTGNSINGEYKYIDGQGLVIADGYFPNNYGLYNMSGNAAEMLQEKGSTKGGSWNSTGYHVRIDAEDEHAGWEEPNPYIGFRPIVVVRKK